MTPINKVSIVIQDISNTDHFFSITETKEIDRGFLPMLNETVVLPFSSCLNGLIFNKTKTYVVTEIKSDFTTGILTFFCTRTL